MPPPLTRGRCGHTTEAMSSIHEAKPCFLAPPLTLLKRPACFTKAVDGEVDDMDPPSAQARNQARQTPSAINEEAMATQKSPPRGLGLRTVDSGVVHCTSSSAQTLQPLTKALLSCTWNVER